jgi:hypothetical protein
VTSRDGDRERDGDGGRPEEERAEVLVGER